MNSTQTNALTSRLPNNFSYAPVLAAARLLLTALLLDAASTVDGDTLHWDGSASGYWNNSANWVENQVPADGDSLVFPGTAGNKSNTNNIAGLNLNSIEIEAPSYSLNGNSVGLSGMLWISVNALIVTDVRMDISLDAAASIYTYSFLNYLHVYGNITLGGHTLDVGGYGAVLLYGVLGGSGSVTKYGNGTVTMLGSSANTYSGSTTVEEGTLVLNKSVQNAVPHALIIGGNDSGDPTATVRQDASFQIGTDVTINKMGTYDMNGFSETIMDLVLNGGANFDSGTSTLTIAGDVVVAGSGSAISGTLALLSGSHDFNIGSEGMIIWPGAHCHLNAEVSGAGNLTKTGPGSLKIAGDNTYSGPTVVDAGYIMVESDTALGSTAAGTTVNAGARMYIALFSLVGSRHVGNEALTLGGYVNSGGNSNSWAGDVVLTNDAVIDVDGNYLNLTGVLSGSGGFTKDGSGALILSGATNNSYSGATVVNDGQLLLGKTAVSPYYAIGYGSLTVGDGSGAAGSALVRELGDYQLGSIPITVNGDGLLDLNNFYDTVGNRLTLNEGGDVQTGSTGTMAMGANSQVTVDSSSPGSTISGNLSVGSGSCTFDIAHGILNVTAFVSGSANITKTGVGYMYLSSSNTFTGTMTVDQSYLAISHPWALGSDAAGTYVTNSALLGVYGNTGVEHEALTMNSSYGPGAIWVGTGSNSWAGPVTLMQDTSVRVFAGNFLNLSGAVEGTGGLVKLEEGTLILSGSMANSYAGDTRLNAGTLELAKTASDGAIPGNLVIGDGSGGAGADVVRLRRSNQIANTADVAIASSGVFDLDGYYDRMDAVTGSGPATLGAGHLIAGHSGSSFTYDGVASGSGYLWKVGPGTWTLTGDNTYTGTTRIETGTLIVNGSQPGSDVWVQADGVLGGTGMVGDIAADGNVAPGISPGLLTSSNVTFSSTGNYLVELNGSAPGTGYDQLNVKGGVALANAALALSATGLLPSEGQAFVILNNDGVDAVTGTFAGLPEGALVTEGPYQFHITYTGGSGNDVGLVATNTAALATTLAIRATGTNTVVVSWPMSAVGWLLHATTNLGATPIAWTEIAPPYQTNGPNLQVIEPAPAGAKFYRLHYP